MEVSKGIVAAIRNFQGRFLDINKATGEYYDIGDQKAVAKTSQALREDLSMIRQMLYSNCKSDGKTKFDIEEYFAFSVKTLSELYAADSSFDVLLNTPSRVPSPKQTNAKMPSLPKPDNQVSFDFYNAPFGMSTAVEHALDQFPAARAHVEYKVPHAHAAAGHKQERESAFSNISMASLSTISAIHTISSGQSGELSNPTGGIRQTFDTILTSHSHQKIYEAEKRVWNLDYIDEASTSQFKSAGCEESHMSFSVMGEEKSHSSKSSNESSDKSVMSNISLMEHSMGDFSASQATEEMVKVLLGLSHENVTRTANV
jgi:hypothetical protein